MDAQVLEMLTGLPVRCLEETPSTNTLAIAWAKASAPHGALVTADRQTLGRGRRGRSYYSPEGGLYMSLVLRDGILSIGGITTLAAVAVCRFARRQGIDLKIKWVNDCLLDGKKVCGILAEGGLQQAPPYVVVGIGLNVGPMVFPEELKDKAAALPQMEVQMESIAADIVEEIMRGLESMPAHMAEYRARCVTLGKMVRFEQGGQTVEGVAKDVLDDGALVVKTRGGVVNLSSGEITLRMADGSYS